MLIMFKQVYKRKCMYQVIMYKTVVFTQFDVLKVFVPLICHLIRNYKKKYVGLKCMDWLQIYGKFQIYGKYDVYNANKPQMFDSFFAYQIAHLDNTSFAVTIR